MYACLAPEAMISSSAGTIVSRRLDVENRSRFIVLNSLGAPTARFAVVCFMRKAEIKPLSDN